MGGQPKDGKDPTGGKEPPRGKTMLWKPWGKSNEAVGPAAGGNAHHDAISSPVKGAMPHSTSAGMLSSTGVGAAGASGGTSSPMTGSFADIPPEDDVNAKFEAFLAELALPHQKAEQMRGMPAAKKWGLLMQREEKVNPVDTPGRLLYEPGAYVTLLQSGLAASELAKELQSLDVAMRTQPISWVKQFIDGGGLPVLVRVITSLYAKKAGAIVSADERNAQIYAIRVMKAQMSNSLGLIASLAHPDAIKVLSLALNCTMLRTKSMAIEVLAALCLIPPNGHSQVVHAFDYYQSAFGEPRRFQTLVNDLSSQELENGPEAANYRDYQAATMTFFNALCNTPDDVEVRMALRGELVDLGLAEKIQELRQLESDVISTQADIFEDSAANDSELLSESLASVPAQMSSIDSLFAALKAQASQSDTEKLLARAMQCLLLLPSDSFRRAKYWEFVVVVLNQLCLQRHGIAPNAARLSIDVERAIERISADGITPSPVIGSVLDLSALESADVTKLDFGSQPDSLNKFSTDSPSPTKKAIRAALPAKPKLTPHVKMKQVQWTKLSAEKVKSSIWKDIGVNAAAEDAIRREKLDLKELETMFCNGGTGASAATLDDAGGESRASNARATDTKTPESDSPAKLKTVTVLDPKRSNNVSIMLGRVKLSYVEIREALIRMEEGKISETLIKQLQVNKPTPEDIELIKEFTGGNEQKLVELGKAEQFLWEINKVPRLDQRLNILNYKLKFHDRLQESRPQIEAVIEASSQLKDNKKIARLLQIILALGNYMNADSAAKGGAFGFTLDSLTKLIDVKSADRKTSLLNYVVSTIDQKFPDLADLGIAGVVHERASKVSLVTISQEIGELVRGMEGLERELKQPDSNVKGDMIKTYTETFIKENKPSLESLSSRHKLMEEMFKKTIEYYGEDPSTTPAFFGIFSTFLLHVDRARKENIKLEVMNNKTSEKSSKQAEKEQEKRKLKENVSKVLNSDNKQIMDDLISALKKGDHFKVAPRVPSHGGLHPGAADSDGPRPRPTRLPPPLPLPKA